MPIFLPVVYMLHGIFNKVIVNREHRVAAANIASAKPLQDLIVLKQNAVNQL
jgi:hypothetical protein